MPETETVSADAYLGEDGAFQEGWFDSLPEGTFEKDDTGKLKQGDLAEIPSLPTLVKNHLNAQKLLGTAIQPLPEDATPEQKKAYKAKVGCPDTVEGYEIAKPTLPEGMVYDDELLKNCSQYAHDNHMPKGVFEGLAKMVFEGQIKKYAELIKVAQDAAKAETEEKAKAETDAYQAAETELKGGWGADHDKNLEMANRFYDLPGDDAVNKAFTDLMAEKGLNTHPAVVKFMYEAYKLVKVDEVPGPAAPPAGKAGVPGQLDYSTVQGNSGK